MKIIVLREMLGPAEQDFLKLLGRWTPNEGRKLMEIACEEITVSDSPFLEARIRNDQGVPTDLRIPASLVLMVLTRQDERRPVGFVDPQARLGPDEKPEGPKDDPS